HMSHVHDEVGANLVRDVAETLPIHHAGISGEARHDQLRLVLVGQSLDLVVVDLAGFSVQTILDGIVHTAGKADGSTVGQVTTVGQAHTQHGVARLQQRHVHRRVGL